MLVQKKTKLFYKLRAEGILRSRSVMRAFLLGRFRVFRGVDEDATFFLRS